MRGMLTVVTCLVLLLAADAQKPKPKAAQNARRAAARRPAATPAPVVAPRPAVVDEKAGPASVRERPYVVSLRRRSDLGYICAGVLIGKKKKHVLTAAHCVDAFLLGGDVMPRVVVGSDSPTKKSGPRLQVIASSNVEFNPGSAAGRPDLAIVTLKKAAKGNQVRSADLPDPRFRPAPETLVTAFGWGRRSEKGPRANLRRVSMRFRSKDICEKKTGKYVPPFNVCTGGRGVGTCLGDNGGPLILDGSPNLVVGIVGEEHACGEDGVIDVHASVADAMEWIENVVGKI